MAPLAKLMVFIGLSLIVVGVALQWIDKISGLGRLPGDIYFKKGPVTFYFPVVTCLIISLVLSLILTLFWRK